MKKKKLTLIILAAGIGSRYGGLKQLDSVTKNDETILDFSIYDAIKAGFNKIIFIVRKNIEKEFINDSISCAMIGMNVKLMSEYIEFVADRLIYQLGYPKLYNTVNLTCFSINTVKHYRTYIYYSQFQF